MTSATTLHADFTAWPAIAIQLTLAGEVQSSNGRLESLLEAPVVGKALGEFLDEGPTTEKWKAAIADTAPSTTLELIFRIHDVPVAPRAFSLLRSDDDLTLIEHPVHPRLAQLAAEVESTNTDLSTAQRALVIERARLAAALRELERSNQALDEFAHAVSHDLKAPLRAIKDAAAILSDPAAEGSEREKYSARVVELVGRMRRMIDGVFEYARAGRAGGTAGVIDTRQAITELVAFLNPPSTIQVIVDPKLPTITGDRVPFDQVFRNLLSNAFTYRRGDGACVEVTGKVHGDCAEISVHDNGPGIPEAQQSRIWRLFHTSRPGEGTGIGLAVVKRLVEAQGGSIVLDSIPGTGSTFLVRWPVKPRGKGVANAAH